MALLSGLSRRGVATPARRACTSMVPRPAHPRTLGRRSRACVKTLAQLTPFGTGVPTVIKEDTTSVSDFFLELTVAEEEALKTVRTISYSSRQYVKDFLVPPMTAFFPNSSFVEPALDKDTAKLAEGYDVVCIFVNDFLSAEVAEVLAKCGVKLVALRCAGYDRVDVAACAKHGIKVCRVPTYSPESVAEHAVALLFALNRHLHTANIRVRIGNYSLSGLVGMQLKGKVVGVVGTGAIGYEACRIFKGIGCNVIAYDVRPNPKVEALGIKYASLDEMLPKCDIVSLHCPLLPTTRHLVNKETLAKMKDGVVLINVSRGGLIDSDAVIDALEEGKIGALGLDVYENEQDLFFQDHTMYETTQRMGKWDRKFKILTSYPQVLVTPHSAFLTREALSNIAATTVQNIADFKLGRPLVCEVTPPAPAPAPAAAPAAAAARA